MRPRFLAPVLDIRSDGLRQRPRWFSACSAVRVPLSDFTTTSTNLRPAVTVRRPALSEPRRTAVTMSDKADQKGGKILDVEDADLMEKQGRESQTRREEAAAKRRKEEEERKPLH